MIRNLFIFIVQCMLLTMVSCVNDSSCLENELGTVSFNSLKIGFSDNLSTRAIGTDGYEGVVKRVFVEGDVVKIYKDDVAVSTAICQGSDNWILSSPLKLIKGRRTEVKMAYEGQSGMVEVIAIAIYNMTGWDTGAEGCCGTITSDEGGLTVVMIHCHPLICIEKVRSEIGTVRSIKAVIDNNELELSSTTDHIWAWEALGDAGGTMTAFTITLDDETEFEVPLDAPLSLEANKKYKFQLYLLPGEFRVTMDAPAQWENGDVLGNPVMKVITSLDDMKNENGEYVLDGEYLLANDILLEGEHTPIGSFDKPFTGILDGNGYCIKGLNIGSSTEFADIPYAGLFAALGEGAMVRNVRFEDVEIYTTGIATGILAGYAEVGVRFDHCSVKGYEAGKNTGKNIISVIAKPGYDNIYAGGLIGHIISSGGIASLSRCWITHTNINANAAIEGDVTAGQISEVHCGGLVGRAENVTVISSYAYFANSEATGAADVHYVGGLIGSSYNDTANLNCCFGCNAREVSALASGAANNSAGDLIGFAQGESESEKAKIASCYATKNNSDDLGGFIQTQSFVDIDATCVPHTVYIDAFRVLNGDEGSGIAAPEIEYDSKTWRASKIWVVLSEMGSIGFPYINLSYNGE